MNSYSSVSPLTTSHAVFCLHTISQPSHGGKSRESLKPLPVRVSLLPSRVSFHHGWSWQPACSCEVDHAVPSGPLHEMLWYGKYRFKGDEEATKGEFPGHLKALTGKRKRGWGGASQVWVREGSVGGNKMTQNPEFCPCVWILSLCRFVYQRVQGLSEKLSCHSSSSLSLKRAGSFRGWRGLNCRGFRNKEILFREL